MATKHYRKPPRQRWSILLILHEGPNAARIASRAFSIRWRWHPMCLVHVRKVVTFVLVESFLHVKQRFTGHDLTRYDPRARRTSPGCEGAVFQPQQCSRHDLIFSHTWCDVAHTLFVDRNALRRYPKHCMVSNQTVVAIFQTMTPKDFQQLQHDLEEAMLKLKNAREPKARRDLLVEMRRLLAEADRFNQEPE
jgi:hypothetical protein